MLHLRKRRGPLESHQSANGFKDDNMILDVYSGGLVIKPFRESIGKLSCGEEIDNHLIRDIIG